MTHFDMLQSMCVAVALAMLMTTCASGKTYFVATTGSDADDGTLKQPFRTIQRAADVMKPVDTCFVRRGVYRETVRPASSGDEGKPITFAAYQDEKVVVSGADPVSGWRVFKGRIYQAATDWDFDQLFVDGKMMNLARWPNAPLDPMRPAWALAGAGTRQGVIVDPRLPDSNLAGAMMHILPGAHWVTWTRQVKEHDPGARSIKFEGSWSQEWAYVVKEGSRYYLFGLPEFLDSPGEWHLDREWKTVRLWTPQSDDPGKRRVEVKRRDLAFDLSQREHIRVEGFRIFASGISMGDAGHCVVRNCHLRYACHFTEAEAWGVPPKNSGVLIGGHGNLLCDSSVVFSAGNGIAVLGENNTVRNCLVRNADYMAGDYGAVWADGRRHTISHNTLCETGRTVLVHRTLRNGRIEYNDMCRAGLLTADLGITYCYATDGEGTVIAYNLVHDNRAASCGVGIYIDNGSSNFIIHHNVCWGNQDSGIRLNIPSNNNLVCNNTVVDNLNSIGYWAPDDSKDQAGSRVVNNICTDEVRTGDGAEVTHNFVGKSAGFINARKGDFRLRKNSPCVDAGRPVAGITLRHAGKAPDIGAYEYGLPEWKAGHDWGEPPVF